jgi:hypothetical protein
MKRKFTIIISLIIIDILIIGIWIFYLVSWPSDVMYLLLWSPFVFMVNLIIAFVVYFFKKSYAPFLIANSFISVLVLFFLFTYARNVYATELYESWKFSMEDTYYYIYRCKDDNSYHVDISCGKGCSQWYDRGYTKMKNDTIYFLSIDNFRYHIYDNYLYNFKNTDRVKVKKRY